MYELLSPNLSKNAQGYVFYKGIEVEHYSFDTNDPVERRRQYHCALDLEATCQKIESLGLPVNSHTVTWSYSWFEGFIAPHNLARFLSDVQDFYEHPDGRLGWYYRQNHKEFHIWHNSIVRKISSERVNYERLIRCGWQVARCGQPKHLGTCFASTNGVLKMLQRHGIERNPYE